MKEIINKQIIGPIFFRYKLLDHLYMKILNFRHPQNAYISSYNAFL